MNKPRDFTIQLRDEGYTVEALGGHLSEFEKITVIEITAGAMGDGLERRIGYQRAMELVENSGIKGSKAISKLLFNQRHHLHELSALESEMLDKLDRIQRALNYAKESLKNKNLLGTLKDVKAIERGIPEGINE